MASLGSSTCLPFASDEFPWVPFGASAPPAPTPGPPKSLAGDLLWVPWALVAVDYCETVGNRNPALRLCGDGQETCGIETRLKTIIMLMIKVPLQMLSVMAVMLEFGRWRNAYVQKHINLDKE